MSLAALYAHLAERLSPPYADPAVSVVFGKREPPKQVNQGAGRANRVCLVPGDDSGGLGTYDGKTERSRNPRHLWNWALTARLYVWAYEPTRHTDEFAQWRAFVELHDLAVEALHTFAPGFYSIANPKEAGGQYDRRFGYEAVILVTLRQPVLATQRPRTGAIQGQGTTLLVTPSGEEPGC